MRGRCGLPGPHQAPQEDQVAEGGRGRGWARDIRLPSHAATHHHLPAARPPTHASCLAPPLHNSTDHLSSHHQGKGQGTRAGLRAHRWCPVSRGDNIWLWGPHLLSHWQRQSPSAAFLLWAHRRLPFTAPQALAQPSTHCTPACRSPRGSDSPAHIPGRAHQYRTS